MQKDYSSSQTHRSRQAKYRAPYPDSRASATIAAAQKDESSRRRDYDDCYDRSYDGRRDRFNDRHDRSYQDDGDHDNRLHFFLPDEDIDYQGPEATVAKGLHPRVGTSLFRP